METKIINLNISGIIRNLTESNSPDGACQEIINMRFKDKNWKVVGDKVAEHGPVTAGIPYATIYRHPKLADNEFIGYNATTNKIDFFSITGSTITIEDEILDLGTEVFSNFSHIGNVLIVSTDLNRHYLLYSVDNDSYTELPDPPMPFVEYYSSTAAAESTAAAATFDAAKTAYGVLVVDKQNAGYTQGYVLIRTAYQLFDNSYIYHSKIQRCLIGASGTIYNNTSFLFNTIYFGKLQYLFRYETAQITNLTKWAGIIKSMSFFATPVCPIYKINTALTDYTPSGGNYIPKLNTLEVKSQIIDNAYYYKIKTILLEDVLSTGAMTAYTDFDQLDWNTLQTRETLPDDEFTHHKYNAADNFNYNSRLHLGNISTIFGNGYNPCSYHYGDSLSSYTFRIEIFIKTDRTQKVIYDLPYYYKKNLLGNWYIYWGGIIMYPDRRAYQMRLIRYSGTNYRIYQTWALTAHPVLNFSYYDSGGVETYTDELLVTNKTGYTDDSDKVFNDTNRVQVSGLDNPFYYPVENSYQVSDEDSEVMKLVTQSAEPISEGQFGQFPVIIFTTKGIWSLEQGSGGVLYAAITPLNVNEICNNANSILNIGGAIVYSTENGLRLLQGRKPDEISESIEGDIDNPLSGNSYYVDVLSDDALTNLYSFLSEINFLNYIANAIVGYDFIEKEIILSYISDSSASAASSVNYSYVYSLITGLWTKRDEVYSQFINDFPRFLGVKDDGIYDISQEDTTIYKQVLIQTRLTKFGNFQPKKIINSFFRGKFDVKVRTYAGIYIFATNDDVRYFLAQANQLRPDDFGDLKLNRVNWSARGFIFVFTGQFANTSFSHIEVTVGERFSNKLR